MTFNEIITRFDAKRNGKEWVAKCPAHDDSTPSLSINEGNNGCVLMKCHAGCPTENVLAAKGLKMADLFLEKTNEPRVTTPPEKSNGKLHPDLNSAINAAKWFTCQTSGIDHKQTKKWPYHNALGEIVAYVIRFDPVNAAPDENGKTKKRFVPIHRDGAGWRVGDPPGLWPLYSLVDILKSSETVFISEGEKAAEAGKCIGLICSTSAHGSQSPNKTDWTPLNRRDVVIIPDNDESGIKYVKLVKKHLAGIAKSICVIELPGLPPKGDIYNFVEQRDSQDTEDIKNEILKLLIPPNAIPSQKKTTSISETNRFKIFYNGNGKGFLAPDDRGGWVPLAETQIKRLMKSKGVEKTVQKGELVSEIDSELIMIQTTQNVDYAGPLAGHYAGMLQIANHRILVTESPTLIEPKAGDWDTYKTIIEGLLGTEQLPFFYGWVKVAYESLRAGVRTPGQAIAMAGPRNSGKSLIQNLLTPIFGGRCSRPYEYMTAVSPFNSHLFGAEHLMVEDEAPSTDLRARRAFGAQIKSITVNLEAQCHAKGQTPIMLRPFWRLSITLNDEPENLMVLPPVDESIFDKLTLFKSNHQEMPMPTASPSERSAFWDKLLSELPAFLAFLTEWQIPPEMVSQRFGIIHYHHPELMEALNELAPEHRLMTLIDGYLFNGLDQEWKGTAEELERSFTNSDSKCRFEASQLLKYNTACGTYLGRLAKRFPKRFEYERCGAIRTWTIFAPNQENKNLI